MKFVGKTRDSLLIFGSNGAEKAGTLGPTLWYCVDLDSMEVSGMQWHASKLPFMHHISIIIKNISSLPTTLILDKFDSTLPILVSSQGLTMECSIMT